MECFSGAVMYCIAQQAASGEVDLPRHTDYWSGEHLLDAEGLPYILGRSGKRYRNPSSIANAIFGRRVADFDALCRSFPRTEVAERALDWLRIHQHFIGGDTVVWRYDYDTQVDDVVLKAPWASAFSQASIVERLLVAACATGNKDYLDLARRAGRAFAIPVTEGGLRSEAPGFTWFQEVPLPDRHNPYIVNAHLYSIVVLRHLNRFFPEDEFLALAEQGLAAFEQVVDVIDTGSWNRYELRPRYPAVNFAVHAPGVVIASAKLRLGSSESSVNFATGERKPEGNGFWGDTVRKIEGRGVVDDGTLFLQFILPRGRDFDISLLKEDITLSLRISCCDQAVQLGALGLRPGPVEYFRVSQISRERRGNTETVRFELGFNDFSWGQVAPEYIPFHAELLAQISLMSERPDLYLRALRWQGFSRRLEEREDQELWRDRWAFAPDPDLATHLWTQLGRRRPNEVSEAEIEAAIGSLYPLEKIASCGERGSSCGERARARASLALPQR